MVITLSSGDLDLAELVLCSAMVQLYCKTLESLLGGVGGLPVGGVDGQPYLCLQVEVKAHIYHQALSLFILHKNLQWYSLFTVVLLCFD